ncbi:MAG TPA: hypothetical protein VFK09_13690 [Gemmatimonadales bacterium]|nr:hypothetical protein [Gemmatimonadales bacterium]
MSAPNSAARHAGYALTLVAVIGSGAGCAGHTGHETSPPDPRAAIPLNINNATRSDIVVYVEHDGQTSRINTVTAASNAQLLIPGWMLRSRTLRLVAHQIGIPGSFASDLLYVEPGRFIEWRVLPNVETSAASVY